MWPDRRKPSPPKPSSPTEYPSGACVVTEAGRFYINGKFRHKIISDRIFDSWSFPIVVETTEAAVSRYVVVKSLGFRDGSVVKNILDGKIYVISKNERRPVADPDVLRRLGKDETKVVLASNREILLHKEGEVLK